jgi:RNase H.
VAWGYTHTQNVGLPVLGPWQSSQRVEPTAAIHAMEVHPDEPLLIRTDSAWTMAGAVVLAAGYPPDLRWERGDLWRDR